MAVLKVRRPLLTCAGCMFCSSWPLAPVTGCRSSYRLHGVTFLSRSCTKTSPLLLLQANLNTAQAGSLAGDAASLELVLSSFDSWRTTLVASIQAVRAEPGSLATWALL